MLPLEDDDVPPEDENAFQKVLSKWRDIDLTTLQSQLDKQGMEIIESQKDFLIERKELSTKTKLFRKLPDDEKLLQVMSLLKGMIDALTNRSKTAESAFLSLYKLLAEAPDPYPVLEATVAELVNSEEASRLAEENARLRAQVEKQGDISQLRIKLRQKETETEELVKTRVVQKETEMMALIDEKERNWAEREQEYQRQIAESREMVKELKVSQEAASARLNAQDQKFDEGIVGRLAEMDIVVADLERSNLRVAEIERRNAELRAEIVALQSGKGTSAEDRANKVEMNFRTLELEYDTVVQRLERVQEEHRAGKEALEKRAKNMEKEVTRRQEEADTLRTKLRSLDDYDEIKRELEILKHIEFSTGDEDEESDGPAPLNTDGRPIGSSLETLLVSRNKKLSNDLTILRVAHSELESRLAEVQSSLDDTMRDLETQRTLNAKLEQDLLRMNDHAVQYAGSVIGGASTRYTFRAPTHRPASPTSSILGSREDLITKPETPEATILPIITQQRDRFRARNAELEEDLRKQLTIISNLRSEIQTLQKDNLGLYEKVRYLQHYTKNTRNGDVSALEEGEGATGSSRPGAGVGMERYRNAYEESMTPFEAFRGKEAARVYRNLNPFEKIVYSLTRAVLANRYSRNAFFAYCICLHLLVIFVLYWLATAENEAHAGFVTETARNAIKDSND